MSGRVVYDFPSGNEVKDFFKKFRKFALFIIVLVVLAIIGFGSFYTIKEQEQVVITTFGKAKAVTEAGLHLKIPVIQKIHRVDTTIKGFPIGYEEATNRTIESEAVMITKDFNFVNVDFFVEYKVSDPIKYLYASSDPVIILKNIAQSNIRSTVGSYDVDSVITSGKYEIQSKIKEKILEDLMNHDIGLMLVNITIQDSEPPTEEVMEAFKSVETAKQGKDTAINNAKKYRNEKLPQALAEVDKILQQAESTKTKRINEAHAEVARFNEMYEEYIKYPLITKKRMYYEAMEDILPGVKVIIDSGESEVNKFLPLEPLVEGGSN
ncbi:MAG TPA: FtsH protease activity modulator HflK [Clostridiales bacterium]|jgi:membrane protease subunit HflK|nr:FtsH protease activity modulator HflK [Clostridiales bacterium]